MGALLARIDRLQRRRQWLAFPFAVVKKFSEDQSGNLAVLLAYYAFFSIFPLLLALEEVLGLVLHGHPALIAKVEGSALKNLPLIGNHQAAPTSGSVLVVVIGGVLAVYSGLAVAKTAQTAWDTVYLVSRTDQPGFLPKTLRALRLVVVGGLGLILTTLVSGAAASGSSIGIDIGPVLTVAGFVIAVVLNALLFTLVFKWLTVRPVTYRQALPGGIVAAVAFAVLQAAASAFLTHKLQSSKSTYGSFATVIVLLSWFYLQSQVVLLAAQINVVKQYRLWPRALKDPPSTDADFRAYEAYAERERYQPEEDVETSFEGKDREHSAGESSPRRGARSKSKA